MNEDLEMVRGVRDAVGMKLKLRIDPNRPIQQEAAELAKQLEQYQLEYLEQPIPAEPLADAAWLREQTSTPIALNESVTDPASVWEILQAGAAEFLLPGHLLQPGECCPASRLATWARRPACRSSCIVAMTWDPRQQPWSRSRRPVPPIHWPMTVPITAWKDDITVEPLPIEQGRIRVPDKPGLGVAGDPEKDRPLPRRYLSRPQGFAFSNCSRPLSSTWSTPLSTSLQRFLISMSTGIPFPS